MTVKELIDVLFNFNPDSEVYIKYLTDDGIERDRINSISIDVNSNNLYLSSLDEG